MEKLGFMSGAGPFYKRYQAGTTISTRGVPVTGSIDSSTDLASVEPMAASAAAQACVGLAVDTSGTVAATGITDSDALLVSVIINPDLIYRARANAGTTSGTALATTTTTASDPTGVTAAGTTTLDNGAVIGHTGANAGEIRRADDASGSVAINFPKAIATGDQFIAIHGYPCAALGSANTFFDLTTDLTEVVAQTAVTDTDNFVCIDIDGEHSDERTTKLFYHLVANDHLFGSISRS